MRDQLAVRTQEHDLSLARRAQTFPAHGDQKGIGNAVAKEGEGEACDGRGVGTRPADWESSRRERAAPVVVVTSRELQSEKDRG